MKNIHVITFNGCGTAGKLIADLENLQKNENFQLEVTVVPSAEKAGEMGLYGSPTIYIDGVEYQKDRNSSPGFY
jgi:uncharacterized membrane protein